MEGPEGYVGSNISDLDEGSFKLTSKTTLAML